MKFTEGYWRVAQGFSAMHPSHVHDVEPGPDGRSLTLWAPSRPTTTRGDTLSNPEITLRLSAPMDGVVHVEVEHFVGAAATTPRFELHESAADVRYTIDDGEVTFCSGDLEVRVDRTTAQLEFRQRGRRLTGSGTKGIGALTGPDGTPYVYQELALGIGETVHGLGERFGHLVKNGQVVEMWNDDSGTSSDRSYKNIPFYLSSGGYGVLVDHPEKVSFEVGSEKVGRVQFSVPGQRLSYHVVAGPGPKDVLRRLTALTGRPPRLPAWSFGLWLTTSFTTEYDEQTVAGFIDGMAERDIPLSVFHYDCFWMREFRWCDFRWDERMFPDPEARIREHHDRQGVRVCLWINPYIGARSPLFAEGAAHGYLLRRADGSIYQTDFWQSGMALVDFTNPEARTWYAGHLRHLLDQGVDCFKTDFGESVPTDVVYHDGSDPVAMHNYYTFLYNRTVYELLEAERGAGEAVLFARSATAGGQQFPVHWGGDCESTPEAMAETLRGGLSLAASGFGYWAHDIGGFEGVPDPTLYKRWVQFGLLSSHSRLHGSGSVRVPWAYDEESVDVLREFTLLKLSLLPTLARVAEEVVRDGVPMVRPMLLEFPEDPAVAYLDRQYMLGPDLLVAPVLSPDGEVDYYVPAGRWTNLLTETTVEGPGWVHERHGVHTLPLLAREGALLAFQDGRTGTDGDLLADVRLRVLPTTRPSVRSVVLRRGFQADAGEVTVTVTCGPDEVVVQADDPAFDFTLDVDGRRVRAAGGTARVVRG
jgi:alpha-D-xyloside xylohydrolase